jgi:hypothetical protein
MGETQMNTIKCPVCGLEVDDVPGVSVVSGADWIAVCKEAQQRGLVHPALCPNLKPVFEAPRRGTRRR